MDNETREFCKIKNEIIQQSLDQFNRNRYITVEECELYNGKYYEAIVGISDESESLKISANPIKIPDSINEINYILGLPSDEFMIHLISQLEKNFALYEDQLKNLLATFSKSDFYSEKNFLKLLRKLLKDFSVIRIESNTKNRDRDELESIANAFLYSKYYFQNNHVTRIYRNLEEFLVDDGFQEKWLGVNRNKISFENTTLPTKICKPTKLIHYYLYAMDSDDEVARYMSYYKIIEYCFTTFRNSSNYAFLFHPISSGNPVGGDKNIYLKYYLIFLYLLYKD
ncbi:MAG: hypothetical protein IPH52_04205 [Leptospiraceae bacterium]|nr:hypothetical protein [Leptospiraceae bacterium]